MEIDPSTTKYLIQARLSTDGIVEKPDIVGAIFGQTEGLLGDELDLRDLQKSGRIGRIEVEVASQKGKSEGVVYVPSSLDQVETAILASSLETIDRVGPCKARISVEKIEDVRVAKRNKIVERAKQLLNELMKASKTSGGDLTDSVRQTFQMEEVVHYGKERLPAGPNIDDSDAIIVVEGRSDVLNLLKYGIKNVIAVEGTNVPQSIIELAKEKVVTAFVDGDRGGELILRELLQVAEIDFIARAPAGQEVEELTQKQMVKCLRNKVPGDQFAEMLNIQQPQGRNGAKEGRPDDRRERDDRRGRDDERERHRDREPRGEPREQREQREPRPQPRAEERPGKRLNPDQLRAKEVLEELNNTSKAKLMNENGNVLKEVHVSKLADTLKEGAEGVTTVVLDGIITQRILDLAVEKNIKSVVGVKVGNIAKLPTNVEVLTKEHLN
ncbi:MAG: DNA primase DnaG [Thermoplasmata archaeon]|jgi:DNA primase|nr:DNA primase DnaG [Thermoplasmata archaeon]